MPLHFLAQIDCAELPQIDARMPVEGMLFFFAREDEETIWGQPDYWMGDDYRPKPCDDCRVIYVRNVAVDQPARRPPRELRPIRNRHAGYDRVLPDEPGPSVHLAWPLIAMEFDTWPDASAFSPELGYGYNDKVEQARIASFIAATGRPIKLDKKRADWQDSIFPAKPFRRPTIVPVGSMVRQLAYEIIAAVLRLRSGVVSPEETELVRNGRIWLARADEVGANQIMPADEMHPVRGVAGSPLATKRIRSRSSAAH